VLTLLPREARTADYEQRIREARLGHFQSTGRTSPAGVAGARHSGGGAHVPARTSKSKRPARQSKKRSRQALAGLKAEVNSLASEIVRTVLQPATAQSQVGSSQ
jgi:hypothetical protein